MTKSTSSYRVSINSGSSQKWRTAAVLKAVKDRRARLAAAQLASLADEAANNAIVEESGEATKGRSNSISFVAPAPSTKRPALAIQADSIKKDGGADTVGLPIPGTNRYNVSVDQIQSELDNLHRSSETLHKEIHSLNAIRNSLLWLLNKATHYETMRNHSLT